MYVRITSPARRDDSNASKWRNGMPCFLVLHKSSLGRNLGAIEGNCIDAVLATALLVDNCFSRPS